MSAVLDAPITVTAAGELAHAALERCGGVLRPLPAFPESPYLLAGEQLVWLGGADATWHPRRVVLANARPARVSGRLHVLYDGARMHPTAALPSLTPSQLAAAASHILSRVDELGTPGGFGALLAGAAPRFPLDHALRHVAAVDAALRAADAAAFARAATPLLGLGPGLTPSGDDFIGAALFARRALGFDAAWSDAAAMLVELATARTNAISAVLFADLARGAAYAPLHALATAAAGDDGNALIDAARRLASIGHSSGWDMLTGFVTAAASPQFNLQTLPAGTP